MRLRERDQAVASIAVSGGDGGGRRHCWSCRRQLGSVMVGSVRE